MNIFFLSIFPRASARALCDKHVVKMILEVCQLLWCAHHITAATPDWAAHIPSEIQPFKKTHEKHPMAIWVRKHKANYDWAARHAIEMCLEYTRRYKKVHSCAAALEWLVANPPLCNCTQEYAETTVLSDIDIPDGCTRVPLAITNHDHVVRDAAGRVSLVLSYLDYYVRDKKTKSWFSYKFTPNPFE